MPCACCGVWLEAFTRLHQCVSQFQNQSQTNQRRPMYRILSALGPVGKIISSSERVVRAVPRASRGRNGLGCTRSGRSMCGACGSQRSGVVWDRRPTSAGKNDVKMALVAEFTRLKPTGTGPSCDRSCVGGLAPALSGAGVWLSYSVPSFNGCAQFHEECCT